MKKKMNYIKKSLVCAAAAGAATLATAAPEVGNVTFAQSDGSRQVTITYTLTEDAVVTLDVMTNATPNAATGWMSIGGEAVCNAQGAVWRKVTSADADGQGKYTITWRPDLSWADENGKGFKVANGCAKAVLTAWSLTNTPNYMVVDISSTATAATPRKYYPGADYLPGGILDNPDYRTTKLVMRKIMAKDVKWTMGSTALETLRNATREVTHQVQLTNNFYIGVFPVTQAQYALVHGDFPSFYVNVEDRAMRPVESVSYNLLRGSSYNDASCNWPLNPHASSFFGILNALTGISFDLPSEAQWEFAARAGNGDTKWGDGSAILNKYSDANMDRLGRYQYNGGKIGASYNIEPDADCGATNGTAIVGSYVPNDWGLYDVFGNVYEWCLDWYEDNISSLDGKVNINPATPTLTLSGATGSNRVMRGGASMQGADKARPAYRFTVGPKTYTKITGFRVVCQAGLQ